MVICFFELHLIGPALEILIALLIAILLNMAIFQPADPLAAWLLVPYVLWVTFAGTLNAAIWWLNA